VFIHPNGWRKPNTGKGKLNGLFKKMTKENIILYLEIHDVKDGKNNLIVELVMIGIFYKKRKIKIIKQKY
jgi:hypothetical protein